MKNRPPIHTDTHRYIQLEFSALRPYLTTKIFLAHHLKKRRLKYVYFSTLTLRENLTQLHTYFANRVGEKKINYYLYETTDKHKQTLILPMSICVHL